MVHRSRARGVVLSLVLILLVPTAFAASRDGAGSIPSDAPPGGPPTCQAEPAALALATSGAVRFTEDPEAGSWGTWWYGPDDVDVPPPPPLAGDTTLRELVELHGYQDNRTAFQVFKAGVVDGDGVAGRFWSEKTQQVIALLGARETVTPPRMAFLIGLIETAMHDALVVSWHYKYCYLRPAPYQVDPTLRPLVDEREVPSYPSEHAAAAGVASFLLDQFFPGKVTPEGTTAEILALALGSRLVAGANYRSDVDAGYALGKTIAERVLMQYEEDALHRHWNGRGRPDPLVVPCAWKETPPLWNGPQEAIFGQVRPILMTTGDAFRAPPPPACDGPEHMAAMQEVHAASLGLTPEEQALADEWDLGVETMLAPGRAMGLALDGSLSRGLTAMHHQRVMAHVGGALADAGIGCSDTKYAYWVERPYTAVRRLFDPAWTSYVDTPPSPGYVSDHACFFGAATGVLGHLFATDAPAYGDVLGAVASARILGGVQTDHDHARGQALGASVAALYVAHAEADGLGVYG